MKQLFVIGMVMGLLAGVGRAAIFQNPFTTNAVSAGTAGQVATATASGVAFSNAASGPALPLSIANGGSGQTTASAALTAFGGASLLGSNNWGTNGQRFPTMNTHVPTNALPSTGTVSSVLNAHIATSANSAFANWPKIGMQFDVLGNQQYWIEVTNNAGEVTVTFPTSLAYTTQTMSVQYPQDVWYDTTPGGNNVVAYVGSDGTIGTMCGSVSVNANGGGFRLEDFADSTRMTMLNAGGKYGECWAIVSDHNNGNQFINLSYQAPNFSWNGLSSGVMEFTVGIATAGTSSGTITSTGFTNTTGTNVYVNAIGAAVAVTIKNVSGPVATNTVVTGGTIIPLQAGGAVSAAAGLSGTWWVQ